MGLVVFQSQAKTLISNEEMNDIMKFVQALEDSNILLKRTKRRILSNAIRYFRASFLGNMLTGKVILRAGYGKGMLRAGYGSKIDF